MLGTRSTAVLDYVVRHRKACLPLLTVIRSRQDWCDAMDAAKVRYYYLRSKRFQSIITPKAIEHALLEVRKSWPSTSGHEELWVSVIRKALRWRGRFYRPQKQSKARLLSCASICAAGTMTKHAQRTSVFIPAIESDREFVIDWRDL